MLGESGIKAGIPLKIAYEGSMAVANTFAVLCFSSSSLFI